MFKKIISAVCAFALVIGGNTCLSAFAEQTDDLTDTYGTLTVTVNSPRDVNIKIEKTSKYEGTVTYYDRNYGNGFHEFTLDSSEYAGNNNYDSYYTLTVSDSVDTKCFYKADNIIVYDGGFDGQPDKTNLNYNVTVSLGGSKRDEKHSDKSGTVENGVYTSQNNAILTAVTLPGDVNLDGKIDSSDAAMILTDYAEALIGDTADIETIADTGDVTNDGEVNSSDAAAILVYYAEILIGNTDATLQQ